MLVPFDALQQLPKTTLDNMVKEYLLTQLEDGSFASLDETALQQAIAQCMLALKRGELVVEYSEEQESIAIRPQADTINN
ncbi:YheU family protein [Shewanella sp. Scap07]|uniref:YheU family protein n=1 Tax=Shewanella sp. Scap07 TaxID=2589987 RepID=UPI0015B9578F|nr:YheU family protein [Shewanella sp. Scap07]QLE86868.1 YheU family protein [Shewanella sp. Scap07]